MQYFSSYDEAEAPSLRDLTKALEARLEAQYDVRLDISYSSHTNGITLSRIVANQRSNGTGTAVMKELCAFADQHRVLIGLSPSSDFGGTKSRLVRFYQRFGFVQRKYKGEGMRETMIREPLG